MKYLGHLCAMTMCFMQSMLTQELAEDIAVPLDAEGQDHNPIIQEEAPQDVVVPLDAEAVYEGLLTTKLKLMKIRRFWHLDTESFHGNLFARFSFYDFPNIQDNPPSFGELMKTMLQHVHIIFIYDEKKEICCIDLQLLRATGNHDFARLLVKKVFLSAIERPQVLPYEDLSNSVSDTVFGSRWKRERGPINEVIHYVPKEEIVGIITFRFLSFSKKRNPDVPDAYKQMNSDYILAWLRDNYPSLEFLPKFIKKDGD